MPVNCINCGEIATRPVACSICHEFSCDKCTVSKSDEVTCVKCFLKSLNVSGRKMWTDLLKRKGIIKERVEDILNYLGSPVTEFSYTRINDIKSFIIKTKSAKGIEYNRVSEDVFKAFWEKAKRLGFEPKKIPFGERIIVQK
ncbi:MAG: hypothetical protein HYT71_03975 [Candidatus Aenigmarchaeota archaeon]|nr:hypothetical protein [Candidatus Aenigmarchaeota archaeon]